MTACLCLTDAGTMQACCAATLHAANCLLQYCTMYRKHANCLKAASLRGPEHAAEVVIHLII